MRPKLLMTTAALSLVLGATGFAVAQDRGNADSQRDRNIQSQDRAQPNRANPNARSNERGTTGQAPSTNAAPANSNQSQTAPSQSPGTAPNANSQNQPATHNDAAGNQPAASQNNTGQNGSRQPSSAQSTEPSLTQPKPPAAAQSDTPKQQQPSTASGNQNRNGRPATAQQPAAGQGTANQAAAPQNNVRVSATLKTEQKTRLQRAVARLDAKPVTNVNFSVAVGTAVPRTVSLRPVPRTIVAIVPQYRGYNYFVVRDEIVIVEPSSHRIVDVIERGGGPARAQATTTQRKLKLTTKQKNVIRRSATREVTTTGAAPRSETRVIVGEEVPDTVVFESFPEEVYREVPAVRSYRYIRGDRGIYIVEPETRRVIEELD